MVLFRSLFTFAFAVSTCLAGVPKPIEDHYGKHGKTRKPSVRQTINLTWEDGAPNGQAIRKMIKMNGQFPGPNIVVTEGDWLEITINNNMPFNTTVHWHGLE
jgi:FtsP/CotA-like multicopper oxidase with cupredoxin domain